MGAVCGQVDSCCEIVDEIVNAVVAVIDGRDATKIRAVGKSCRQLNREVGDSLKATCNNVRWKRQRLHFRKEHERARRLRVQGDILKRALDEINFLAAAHTVIECRLRDAPSHGHFEAVADMVAKEQRFTKQRIMFPRIFETLGVEHFKQRALDNSAFIIKNENGVALDYILGDEPSANDTALPIAS